MNILRINLQKQSDQKKKKKKQTIQVTKLKIQDIANQS